MPGNRLHCIFCSWSEHSHRVPAHILKHHIGHIQLDTIQHDHCISGHVVNGTNNISFAVCLTCKKGTVENITEGNGLRWMSLHSKKDACRAAHTAAYSVFIDKWKESRTAAAFEVAIEAFKANWLATQSDHIVVDVPDPVPTLIPVDPPPIVEPEPTLIPPPTTGTGGWVYCFENDCMPGIYKVGVTRRTPDKRLTEANSSSTWTSPTPFRLVLSAQSAKAFDAEKRIHRRLSELGYRIHPRREFFNAPLPVIQTLFEEVV
jgi:hypothetical protein